MSARTAHIVGPGSYLPHGLNRRVEPGMVGLWCEACEWTVRVPRRHGMDRIEALRRQHIGHVHFDALLAGAMVLDPSLGAALGAAGLTGARQRTVQRGEAGKA